MHWYADHEAIQRRRRYSFAGVALVCVLVACAWFFGVNHSTIEAWATLPEPSEGPLPYPSVSYPYQVIDFDTIDWNGPSISQALGEPAEDVQARALLMTVAHVHDGRANPIRGASVVFTLSSETGSQTSIDHTNHQGTASCTHWIPAEAEGTPMIVTAEVSSGGWTGAQSMWFVPE